MRSRWTLITGSASWPPRDSPGAVAFADRIWLLGGFHCDASGAFQRLNDVWSSADGRRWERVMDQAPWSARNLAGCVARAGRMYLMGGFDGRHTFADIWASTDGRRWERLTESAPWGARGAFGCTVHDGRIWVMGGSEWEHGVHFADVWSSVDGAVWERVIERAPWGPRAMFPVLVHDGAMWLFGGGIYHDREHNHSDVWRSVDGLDWEPITRAAAWAPRRFHKAIAHRGALWLMGGASAGSINRNDVWVSTHGRDWICTHDPAPWGIRHEFGLLELQQKVWLLGGFSGEIAGNLIYHDIWQLESESMDPHRVAEGSNTR